MAVRVPKLKGALFESAVIERYRRREESVEEALIDMYLAGVSTRRVVPGFLRTLVFVSCVRCQFASCMVSWSRDMSR
jgi:transposase-like protein